MNKTRVNGQAKKGGAYPKETSIYKEVRTVIFYNTKEQKQMFNEHSRNFGTKGSWSNEEANKFKQAVIAHVQAKDTYPIEGPYNKKPAIQYYNKETILDVIVVAKESCKGYIKTIRKSLLQARLIHQLSIVKS